MEGVSGRFTEFGLDPSPYQLDALGEVVAIMEAMAEGTCPPRVYLSSLDPGVGKTTTLVEFIKQVVASPSHCEVGVLVCLSRLDEVARLVEECGLDQGDFAVLTADRDVNALSSTPHTKAQVLFTTQQMLMRRCAGGSFAQCTEFHFIGSPRSVRVWDETLEPGEVVTLSTDDLGGLLPVLRPISLKLADVAQDLLGQLLKGDSGDIVEVSTLDQDAIAQALAGLPGDDIKRRLGCFAAMSGRSVRLLKGMGNQRIALDTRDALPRDLTPLLVLDASGRIRKTYTHWEKLKGGLVRLQSAPKDYGPLTIHVLDQGGGKDSWQKNMDRLALEVASVIDSKPDESWLVVHHQKVGRFDPKTKIRKSMNTDCKRVCFIHWGAHQATNDFKDISNVILAGTLFLPESQYLGLAYASSGIPLGDDLPPDLVKDIRLGEHGHGVLQALCRASVRGSVGARCRPCNAYIIATKGSGIRGALPNWFPGCRVKTWKPRHKPLKGQVGKAVVYVKQRLKKNPGDVILFTELMAVLNVTDRSNFNNKIRKDPRFKSALKRLGVEEVSLSGSRYKNALQRCWLPDDDYADETENGHVPGSHI